MEFTLNLWNKFIIFKCKICLDKLYCFPHVDDIIFFSFFIQLLKQQSSGFMLFSTKVASNSKFKKHKSHK